MALVIGAIMLVVYLLFIDKDALFRKSEKKEDVKEAEETTVGDTNADA